MKLIKRAALCLLLIFLVAFPLSYDCFLLGTL